MKAGLIIGISVLVLVLILVIFYFVHKGSSAVATAGMAPDSSSSSAAASTDCKSYSTDQQKRDIQHLRSKCMPKLMIPIVGIGAYGKCMQEGKSKLPPIC